MTSQLFVLSGPSWTREFLQIYWAGTHVDSMTLVGCLNFQVQVQENCIVPLKAGLLVLIIPC
jgi:hypothetical protein